MISAGRVRVNNQSAKPSQKIKPGDVVDLDKPKPTSLLINGQPSALEILFEDSACLVINKPAGVAAHPGPGHWDDTPIECASIMPCGRESSACRDSSTG